MQITINRDGQQYGPYPIEDAAAHLATGGLLATDWAFMEGMTDWAPLGEVIAAAQAPTPVAAPVPPAAAQPAAAQPAAQPMAAQPMAAQPMAAQPMAAQPMAAQPMAAQPMAAQLASPSQLSTGSALASPSQLGTGGGSSVAAKAKKTSTPKPSPDKPAKASKDGSKGFLAGKRKLVFAVVGIIVSVVVIGMQLTGEDEDELDVVSKKVNVPAANNAKTQLKNLGAEFDYDLNGGVSSISLQGKTLTPTHLGSLLEFKNLQRVTLIKCDIDDAALQRFKGLSKLSFLDVSGNPKVTDGCIDTLSTIKTLQTLNASDTGITSVGEEKLKEALPDCNVTIKAASAEPAK
jgi:hypothetical protein